MFTQLVKIAIYTPTGIRMTYYDDMVTIEAWHAYCIFELGRGYIGGFSINITNV